MHVGRDCKAAVQICKAHAAFQQLAGAAHGVDDDSQCRVGLFMQCSSHVHDIQSTPGKHLPSSLPRMCSGLPRHICPPLLAAAQSAGAYRRTQRLCSSIKGHGNGSGHHAFIFKPFAKLHAPDPCPIGPRICHRQQTSCLQLLEQE